MRPITKFRINTDYRRFENERLNYWTDKLMDGGQSLQLNIINQSHVHIIQFRIAPK